MELGFCSMGNRINFPQILKIGLFKFSRRKKLACLNFQGGRKNGVRVGTWD